MVVALVGLSEKGNMFGFHGFFNGHADSYEHKPECFALLVGLE